MYCKTCKREFSKEFSNTTVKRMLVTPDKHFPLADRKAINCLIKAIGIIKPDIYVDLGDVGEWEGASHWQWKKKRRPPLEYQIPRIDDDVMIVNAMMDDIDEALDKVNCSEKHFCEGNHDNWMNYFVDENPYLDQYSLSKAIKLSDRGYAYHPSGKYLKIGKLNLYHGHHFAGIHHARNHLLRLGGNVMYAHHHDIQQTSVTHIDGVKSAWSIGCLKDMSEENNLWLGGKRHNWGHAFAVVDYFEDGYFTVHVVQVINGKCSLWGDLLDGTTA